MRWTVALQAEGDREVRLEEVVELADAVAIHEGVASGMGTNTYGAQIIVEAETSDEAVEKAMSLFTSAAERAGLPSWPVVSVETEGEEEAMGWYDEIPDVEGFDGGPAG